MVSLVLMLCSCSSDAQTRLIDKNDQKITASQEVTVKSDATSANKQVDSNT